MASIRKRVYPDGRVVHQVQIRIKGAPPQAETFDRLTDARQWAARVESDIRRGLSFPEQSAKRRTLSEAIDKYLETVMPGKRASTREGQIAQLEWWRDRLGHLSLPAVTPAVLSEARDALAASTSRAGRQMNPATVARYLAALSHVLTTAHKEWGWLTTNPCQSVSRPKENQGRVRFLSDEERETLLAACRESRNPVLYAVVVLALSTGMRRGEILGLEWGRVDMDRGLIILEETKNGERRGIPLMGHALEVMREHGRLRRLDTSLVFPSRYRRGEAPHPADITVSFENAVKRAGLEDFHFHDCRHSCASYLAMNGATLAEIAEVLGHKTLQMVKRYSHLSLGHTAKVLGRMNARMFPDAPASAKEGGANA